MAVNIQQIQDLLGTGLSPEVVASAVGCTESYVSQLMSDEAFAAIVIEKRSKALTKNNERDLSIDELEDKTIRKLNQVIDMVHKPMELMHLFKAINSAKRRGIQPQHQATQRQQVVVLAIPERVKSQFRLSANREIIDHGEQTLVTMDSQTLLKRVAGDAETKGTGNGNRYKELAASLRKEEAIDAEVLDI